jgi:ABC-type sugar transport system substrate-binding protein
MSRLRFLVSLITKSNDYQVEQAVAAQKMALQLGVDADILYAENDAITQSTQILKAIQAAPGARPNGVIFEPVGGTALPQVARAAAAANIAWAVLNREADYISELRKTTKSPFFSLSSDHTEIGKIQGKQFCALLPRGGAVLYLQGPSENSAARERAMGMQTTISSNIQITTLRGQWTEESAYKSVNSWLKLNVAQKVHFHLIGAQNDLMAMGARKAFQDIDKESDRELWLRLPYTGVDGLEKTGKTWVRTGVLTATVIVPTNADQAMSMLTKAIQVSGNVLEHTFTVAASYPPLEKLVG